MILILQQLPQLAGPDDDDYRGLVPQRFLYMLPEAAKALMLVEQDTGGLIYTDIFRSAESSLKAYQSKPGTQPPAYSYHNYGGCADVDVDRSLKKLGTNYEGLVEIMAARQFYCHRRDGNPTASESWHFNYLGDDADALLELTTTDHSTWARPAEAMIQKWYGPGFQLTADQVALLIPIAHATDIRDFQRRWGLVVDGVAGPKTQRVLAYATATQQIETDPAVAA
jgi:hypothetical protein